MKKRSLYLLWILVLVPLFSGKAFAVGSAGFENAVFSPKFAAEANAGVAQADEPAAISYNPAGITQLKGIQIQQSGSFLSIFTRHAKDGDINYSSGTLHLVPTAYLTVNPGRFLNNRVTFGIGTDSPFGLANNYDSNQPYVHYTGYNNWLKMFTIKPVMAVRFSDKFSVAAGPVYYRVFSAGNIAAYPNKILQSPLGPFPGPPFLPNLPDGQVRADFTGNSWGWHIGGLLKLTPKHHFGFYFRSPVNLLLKGQVKAENVVTPAFTGRQFITTTRAFETGAQGKLNLPLNMTVGYAFHPNDRAVIETDFGYTRWSIFKRLYINTDHVTAGDDAILNAIGKQDKDYNDSYSIHLGGSYKVTPKFTVRGGTLFYWAAVPNDHFIPAIPDSNRLAFGLGISYAVFKNTTFDLSYINMMNLRRHINNSISEPLGGSVDGSYFSDLQGFFIGITTKSDLFGLLADKEEKKESSRNIATPNEMEQLQG